MNATTSTYVGLDVHRDTIAVSVRRPGAERPDNWTVATAPEAVRKLARQLRSQAAGGGIRACYEAGPTGFGVQRLLESEGVPCDVIAPSLIPVRPGERRQTDIRDANGLSEHLRCGTLTAIAVPTPEEEAARDLVRRAQRAREELSDLRRQIQSTLLRLGQRFPGGGRAWTKQYMTWLTGLTLAEPSQRIVLEDDLSELQHREARVARLTKHVEELAETPAFAPKVGALRCLRGIETYSAMVLASEIISPERFPSARQFMSYVGLTVAEQSSGLTQRRLGLTKTGNERARRILVESAHHARHGVRKRGKALQRRRADQPDWAVEVAERAEHRLHDRYWALVHRGKPACKAIGAVARELAGYVWYILVQSSRLMAMPQADADGVVTG